MKKAPTILIVEDDTDICILLQEIFRCFNISSHSAQTIQLAKASISTVNPTHIILDNMLPDGYGEEFYIYLKEFHPEFRVIFMTGDTEVTGENIGEIISIIQKPFSKNTIHKAFEDIITKA